MTERGRHARWTAVAVLGPVAAALFAGTTVWTARAPAPTAASEPTAATSAGDVQQTLDEDAARVAALESLVATLRAQAAALAPGPAKAGTAAGSAPAAASVLRPPVSGGPRPAAHPAARPPAVHAVTGGS